MSEPDFPHLEHTPQIHPEAFVAPGVHIIGDVAIGPRSSIWFGCVLRGDVNEIRIGAGSSLQDGTVVHVTGGGLGTYVGDDATVGHRCVLHACEILDRGFVGMSCVVLDGAVVESDAMLGAGSVLTQGKRVLTGQLWLGQPARYARDLKPEEIESIPYSAQRYARLSRAYLARRSRAGATG